MKALPFLQYIILILAFLVSGCVPKATEKKAVCGSSEAFNSVTRSCESIVEPRHIPVATKTSDTLTQESAKTITLTYTDANNNQAISCKVSGQSSNIEAVSPQIISGNIFAKADLFFYAAQDTAGALPIAVRAAALLERDAMSTALDIARHSYNYSIIIQQLGLFRAAALNILTAASSYTGTNNTIKFYYELTQVKMADYDAAKAFVDNRCDCTGGVCTTSIATKIHKSGAASFNYTITDMDGTSATRGVALTITAASGTNAFYKPAVDSVYASGAESDTNVPLSYSFTLGTGKDYVGTTSFTYSHGKTPLSGTILGTTKSYVDSDSGLGKITDCLGLGAATSASDTSCVYVPNSGDAFNSLVPAKASATFNTDLTITAKARGSYGNNISIVFKDITSDLTALDSSSTTAEKFGLVGLTDDVYIRVNGDTIYVIIHDNVTTTEEIANALNADEKASRLVDASAGGSTTKALVSSASAGVTLSGGVAAYDTFTYTVTNGVASSTNTAKANIHISSTLDNPLWKPYPSPSSPLMAVDDTSVSHLEGNTTLDMDVTLSTIINDPDDQASTCVVSTNVVDLALWSSGSNGLSGVTLAEVTKADTDFAQVGTIPTCTISGSGASKKVTFSVDRTQAIKANSFGTYALLFKITDGGTLTTRAPTFQAYKFSITPVNDAPAATAISWSSSSTNPVTSATGTTWNMTVRENSSASPSTSYADITINPDATATGYESSQTVTVSAVSDNQSILKNANISISSISSTVKRISFTTEQNLSGSANITVTLQDNGGIANTGADTSTYTIAVTVSMVNDPPALINNITTIDTNEGGLVQSDGLTIEEDLGKSADENDQEIKITSITSDNTAVLPVSGISVFYDKNDNGVEDSGEPRALNADFDPGDVDVGLHKFYFKLKPVAGISGNANVTVIYSDYTNTLTSNFSLIVHPVAAQHGGWANISAVGIKTDKSGAPVSTNDIKCNYNKSTDTTACNSRQNCTGSTAPHGSVVPDAVSTIYWDSANKKCYRSQGSTKFSWVEMTTTCPVTRIYVSSTTLSTAVNASYTASLSVASTAGYPAAGTITIGSEQISYTSKTVNSFVGLTRGVNSTTAVSHNSGDAISYTVNGTNFIKDPSATPVQNIPVATAVNQYYFDASSSSCYASTETSPGVWDWDSGANKFIPSKITLTWNPFTVTGSGPDSSVQVYGWNVYRREKNKDYDFKAGFLKNNSADTMTLSDATVRTFTDTTAIAGKVYYYVVRPVDSTTRHLTISTPEIYSEVRVLAPVENYAFVHRWMMNQEVCNSMHMTTSTASPYKVDPTKNYRCPYSGPGEGSTPGYYDIGKDLLVDIAENGCPYTLAPECTANGCIDIGNPTTLGLTATAGSVYYDRSAGSCWVINGAGTWLDTNSGAGATLMAAKKVNSVLNPPIVNITKARAEAICNARTTTAAVANLTGAVPPATNLSLPSKKEYIAYSAAPYGMTDSIITDMEQGFSLNIQSRCNSSNANGIEAAFNDSSIPSTSYIYSLPGTASSGIRSIYTGSIPWGNNYSTETCSSRYGIQDVYGNVAEWVKDSMTCNTLQSTTLSAGINNAVNVIPVVSTTGFANAGTLIIDSEQITYTGKTGTTFTGATRGANATVAAIHNIAADVLTADNNNYVCKTVTGNSTVSTDLGRYDFATGAYNNAATSQYAFDLLTGPYNDVNASSTASIGDGFLTEWDFRDELFSAGKFNFPMGMPMNVDIASSALSTSPAIPYLLDIGPTAGITTSQLHEDGIIVNGAVINDITTNSTQTGSFAQGGSYLSGNRSGRYSSELVPDAEVRPDIGFRCYIPVDPGNFPTDPGRHTYSY